MMFGWLTRTDKVRIPPVDRSIDHERDVMGLKLMREGILARAISTEIQETLARGAMARLRNDS